MFNNNTCVSVQNSLTYQQSFNGSATHEKNNFQASPLELVLNSHFVYVNSTITWGPPELKIFNNNPANAPTKYFKTQILVHFYKSKIIEICYPLLYVSRKPL